MISLILCIDKIIFWSRLYPVSVFVLVIFLQNFFMPSFVYGCEECSTELRFMVSFALDENIGIHCPKCNDVKRFKLEREGNVGEDWYSNILIKNKKRRDEDGLYKKSPEREQILAS